MSKIFVVNAGSSSLKFQLLEMPAQTVITKGLVERIGLNDSVFNITVKGEKREEISNIPNHQVAVQMLLEALVDLKIVKNLDEISGVGHRVVHGGEEFKQSALVTKDSLAKVKELSPLAPLHNPANIMGIEAFMEVLPAVKQVMVFDTSFHQTMEAESFLYPVPYEWYTDYAVRKYGFHGTSHKFVSAKAYELLGKQTGNVVTCHIGNGGSITAVKDGKSINTSMGLTPLAGIMMGTRSGDIDPAIIEFVCNQSGKDVHEVTNMLNKKSGLAGVSGVSSDMRDITAAVASGNERAILAFDIYVKRIVDYIAMFAVQLGSVDAVVFTAGIGENVVPIREKVIASLGMLGISIDTDKNNTRGTVDITGENSNSKVFVIETNEELMIALDTVELI